MPIKTKLDISIPTPCHEKWENMQVNDLGRYCLFCQKTVIDFTHKSEKEIAEVLLKSKGEMCGRFLESQLKPIYLPKPQVGSTHLKAYIFAFANILLASWLMPTQVQGQEQTEVRAQKGDIKEAIKAKKGTDNLKDKKIITIQGKIRSLSDTTSLPGVNIVLKGTRIGTVTDVDGYFKLYLLKDLKEYTLVFSFVGFLTQEVKIEKIYDNIILGIDLEEDYNQLTGDEIIVVGAICSDNDTPLYKRLYHKLKHWFQF